jgi:SPOR domain
MARYRQKSSRNWTRGVFATLWILLGGISGAYLFTVISNPSALGGRLVALNSGGGSLSPASEGTTAVIPGQSTGVSEQDLAEIKASLNQLSDQVADLDARFKPIEKIVGPVAALAPAASVSTSPPSAHPAVPALAPFTDTKKPETAAAPPAPPPPEPPAEETKPAQAEAPKPAETPKDEPKPVEQAAVEPAEAPKPVTANEPPPVAVSPMEEDATEETPEPNTQKPAPPAPPAAQESPAPAELPATESAALDPTALPRAANDGSTRYGIEIGTVAKQDALRPLWREFLTNHAALVAGLQPRRVLAPDKKWRLIAGPFASAEEATQACALFKKASRPCEATVYAGDSL